MRADLSLRALVLARRRRWLAARVLECVLAGGGAAAVTLAAARLSGASANPAALLVAGACGLASSAVLLRERWRGELEFTRRFDARLGADGAIVTACEGERGGTREPLLLLLAERTRAGLDRARLARATSPPSPLFAALTLMGLALWAWTAEFQPQVGGPDGSAFDASTARVAGTVGAAARADARERPAGALEATAAAQAAVSDAGSSGAPRETAGVDGKSESARGVLPGEDRSGRAQDRDGEPNPGPSAVVAGDLQGAAQGSGSGSGDPTLAAGAAVRTMSRPLGPDTLDSSTRPDSPAAPGAVDPLGLRGPTGGRFWPRRHDAVVARYVESLERD